MVRNRFHETAEFQDILSRLTLEKETNRWEIEKNDYLYVCLLPWQQPAIYSYEWKRNPRCVTNLHCECQELKPKAETNSSVLVLHRSSGVHTVNTVGSHLNGCQLEKWKYRIYSNKRLGAYLIFRAISAVLIRGRRLFKHCTRQIYFFLYFLVNGTLSVS